VLVHISGPVRIGEKIFSGACLINEHGQIVSVSTKKHIVRTDHFYEQDYYAPGDGGFEAAETSIGKIGTVVCFDRHYPESYRDLALKGADLIVIPVGNETEEPQDIFEWEIRIGAFASSVNVLMCNRVGREGKMDFSGNSLFAGPDGQVIARADGTEQILLADLDLENTAKKRAENNYMKLRRPEVFEL